MERFKKETVLLQQVSSCVSKPDELLACCNRKLIFLAFPETTLTIASFTGTLPSKIDFHIMPFLLIVHLNDIVTDKASTDDLDCTDASDPSDCTSVDAMRAELKRILLYWSARI